MKKQNKKLTLNKTTVSQLDGNAIYGGISRNCPKDSINYCETDFCPTGTCACTQGCPGTNTCYCPQTAFAKIPTTC